MMWFRQLMMKMGIIRDTYIHPDGTVSHSPGTTGETGTTGPTSTSKALRRPHTSALREEGIRIALHTLGRSILVVTREDRDIIMETKAGRELMSEYRILVVTPGEVRRMNLSKTLNELSEPSEDENHG